MNYKEYCLEDHNAGVNFCCGYADVHNTFASQSDKLDIIEIFSSLIIQSAQMKLSSSKIVITSFLLTLSLCGFLLDSYVPLDEPHQISLL